jgi:hypothetical protein
MPDRTISQAASVAKAGGRAASAVGKSATSAAQLAVPLPTNYGGYWIFVVATIMGLFVLYVAKKGTLATWISFFTYQGVAPRGGSAGAGGTPGTVANVSQNALGNPGLSSNPFGGLPTSWEQFLELPSLNPGSPIFGPGGSANPSTGSNTGYGGN